MNKTELIKAIAEKSELTIKDAGNALEAFIDVVTEELKADRNVQLVGFGTFETVKKAERNGRNPATGKNITIPASIAPKFKPGKSLKDAVNN